MNLPLFDILLNPSVKKKDEIRLSKQAKELYDLFILGPITTDEASGIARQYNARINEIRHYLAPKGEMIDEIEQEGGNNKYIKVPLEKSTFWAGVKKRNEEWKWR